MKANCLCCTRVKKSGTLDIILKAKRIKETMDTDINMITDSYNKNTLIFRKRKIRLVYAIMYYL